MNKRDYGRKVFRPLLVALLDLGFETESGASKNTFKKQLPIGELRVSIQVDAPKKGQYTAVYTNIWWPNDEVADLLRKKFNLGYSGKNNYHFEAEDFDHYFPIIMSYIDELHKVEL